LASKNVSNDTAADVGNNHAFTCFVIEPSSSSSSSSLVFSERKRKRTRKRKIRQALLPSASNQRSLAFLFLDPHLA